MAMLGPGVYANGELLRANSTVTFSAVNPATEEALGDVAEGDSADVERVVLSAQAALRSPEWSGLTVEDRAKLLLALADVIEARSQQIGSLVLQENGMPIRYTGGAAGHALGAVRAYRYYAGLSSSTWIEEVRATSNSRTIVRRDPVGVVGVIAPWNSPQGLAAWKIAPALLAGCTVVLKPAPETSLDAFLLMEAAAAAGVPAGVLNVVTGGPATGQMVVEHPGVQKISFTGSTAAGRWISERCGALFKPVTLELGGKSAAIVLDDADLDVFASRIARVAIPSSGQVCYSTTRVLVPSRRHPQVLDALVSALRECSVGDPASPETTFGPVVSARQRTRVESYIAAGVREGARVVLGGGRPAGFDRGYYIQPTVLDGADNSMTVAREEIFGPVVSVLTYETEQEAIDLANDSDFGLGGVVFTKNTDRGVDIARAIDTGTIGINGYAVSLDSPFGGRKNSGLGRELGPEGLLPYFDYKSIFIDPQVY